MILLQRVTPHHWAVYDFVRKIPCGRITTYKHLCLGIGEGSPRSVGAALRANPFAPFVPCHRVVASDLSLGGFYGEWGPKSKTGTQSARKMAMLRREGVRFSERGIVLGGDEAVWRE
jgi:methylated-DNA-[protein]-cysteine S-methyltransferase